MRFVHTADTHLGFEVTRTTQPDPRGRRSRARAMFENFRRTARHALEIGAHVYIHSGDLFNKAYIPREALDSLVEPLRELSAGGVRVLLIPGNHEHSHFPFELFHGAPGIDVFDRAKSLLLVAGGYEVCFAGFPFLRHDSRRSFARALADTEYAQVRADLNILVTHQAFDQAVVGPNDFVFRAGRSDTVERKRIPEDFDYVAAGHIHRYQVLDHPRRVGMQIVYPGSTQRISFAEKDEPKGFVEGEVRGERVEIRFVPLPAYEMETVTLEAAGMNALECDRAIREQFWRFDADRVIRFRLVGGSRLKDYPAVDFDALRADMPPVVECQFALQTGTRWVFK